MQVESDMQVMHAYASIWMLLQDMYMLKWHDMQDMQVCECLCKYVDAYASMWVLMQVMCMLKCMFNMLCKIENAYMQV